MLISPSSQIEPLESRRFLSAALQGGILTVRGTVFDDIVIVTLDTLTNKIGVGVNFETPQAFDFNSVFKIVIRAYAGNNRITVAEGVAKPTYVFTGDGNDIVTTASERDLIYTGAGNDDVHAGNGINVVDLGDGNDTANGGNAVDAIYGGFGNDLINGSGGNDLLVGNAGADSISGGDGNDRMYGGKHNDVLLGGDGNDTIWGQEGDDSIDGGNGNDIVGGVLGVNTLHGNNGNDIFYVKVNLDGQPNDFDIFTDKIRNVQSE